MAYNDVRNKTNNAMAATIKRLYDEGKLTGKGVENALRKGYITRDQMIQITKPIE